MCDRLCNEVFAGSTHRNYIFAQENRDGKSVSVLSDQ